MTGAGIAAAQIKDNLQSIELHVQLTKQDYVRAARWRFWRSLGVLVVVAPLAVAIPILRSVVMRRELLTGNAHAATVVVGMYAGLVLFLAFAVEVCARSFAQHAIRKAALALKPQVLTFTEAGVAWKVNGTSGQLGWNAFRKVTRTKWALLLHLSGGRDIVVPLAQVPATLRSNLERLMKRHLGDRAKFRVN